MLFKRKVVSNRNMPRLVRNAEADRAYSRNYYDLNKNKVRKRILLAQVTQKGYFPRPSSVAELGMTCLEVVEAFDQYRKSHVASEFAMRKYKQFLAAQSNNF